MTFIKLRKSNQSGEIVGECIINSDQITQISPAAKKVIGATAIDAATQIETADGKTHWIGETVEQVLELIKSTR